MNLTQFFILEASSVCNYTARHPECPTSDPRRFSGLDTSRSLVPEVIEALAVRAYEELGFRGFVGFHHYNEPSLCKAMLYGIIDRVRARVPRARFVLWTNGSKLSREDAADLRRFDLVCVTDYDKKDYGWLAKTVPRFRLIKGQLDDRREPRGTPPTTGCVRPYTEFVVDYHGNVRLCCIDWQGQCSPGNVFQEDLAALVRRFQATRRDVAADPMPVTAPEFCRRCMQRYREIDSFDAEIARAARADCGLPESAAERKKKRRQWRQRAAWACAAAVVARFGAWMLGGRWGLWDVGLAALGIAGLAVFAGWLVVPGIAQQRRVKGSGNC